MAAAAEEINFSLKVMTKKEKTKVLFADVDSDFADVLLSFLTLPLGTIVRLLQKHYGDQAPVFGSLSSLYSSLADLGTDHFWTEGCKLMLLNPRSSFEAECHKLKFNIDDTQPTKYFTCADQDCKMKFQYACMWYGSYVCSCGKQMSREMSTTKLKTQTAGGDGVFTKETLSFVISDDLRMLPNVARSFIQSVSNLAITDATGAEQRTVTFGFNEIMELLKGSLLSSTPLTDLILHKTQTDSGTIKFEPVHHIEKEETSKSKKMILRVVVQKSTNKFLFAQAEDDFVDFLFSFLTIPLGGVEWLLGGNSSLRNIDNLYSSSANLKEYLKTLGTEKSLFKPEIAPMYLSKNQIFPLSGQEIPELYYSCIQNKESLSSVKPNSNSNPLKIMDPRGTQGSYVQGPRMYIVTDNLTVTPLLLSSRLSILEGMQVQLSDVKELEFEIGLEEALSILKASLTSTCALSNGLLCVLMKQAKRESRVRI